jgi:(2Fe-2S) ferredoxin
MGLYRDIHDDRPGGVGIYFISHVGGHKYSANIMIYRRQGAQREREGGREGDGELNCGGKLEDEAVQLIWLARVRPEDCENIVRYTVLQGKVVKPQRQLRGGFDRERGLASW